jgi:hypothetical protein
MLTVEDPPFQLLPTENEVPHESLLPLPFPAFFAYWMSKKFWHVSDFFTGIAHRLRAMDWSNPPAALSVAVATPPVKLDVPILLSSVFISHLSLI